MNIFPAKLLLFGEYSILLGSPALSMPFNYFGASLRFSDHDTGDFLTRARESNFHIARLYDHFLTHSAVFEKFLNLAMLGDDIRNGLYLSSTIPLQYGMGSSGALCAAIYDRYRLEHAVDPLQIADKKTLASVRNSFIQMESFFHGRSSGFDPLVSWIQKPMLIDKEGELSTVEFGKLFRSDDKAGMLLVDSGLPCSTGPLVNNFLAEYLVHGKTTTSGTNMCNLVTSAMENFLSGNLDGLWNDFDRLSHFQLNNLGHLVPGLLQPAWKHGLQSGLYKLKLCGSGGGGFLLCFTLNKAKAIDYFDNLKIPVLNVPFS